MSATNIFMRVLQDSSSLGDWIQGESSSLTYNGFFLGWIEVESFSWDIKRKDKESDLVLGNSDKTSTVVPGKLTITKHFDKASPAIFNMMRQNKKFLTVELHFADPTMMPVIGMSFLPVMMMVLSNGHFESASFNADATGKGTVLKEDLTIVFEDMVMTYSAADPITGYRTIPQIFHPTMTDKFEKRAADDVSAALGL